MSISKATEFTARAGGLLMAVYSRGSRRWLLGIAAVVGGAAIATAVTVTQGLGKDHSNLIGPNNDGRTITGPPLAKGPGFIVDGSHVVSAQSPRVNHPVLVGGPDGKNVRCADGKPLKINPVIDVPPPGARQYVARCGPHGQVSWVPAGKDPLLREHHGHGTR
jgi:hypothetical protein